MMVEMIRLRSVFFASLQTGSCEPLRAVCIQRSHSEVVRVEFFFALSNNLWTHTLRIEPLQLIVTTKDSPIHPVSIIPHYLLCVDAVQRVLPLVQATTICAFLCGTEHANMDVPVVYRRQLDLAEEMQAIR
jgi:hypothetical protein